MEAYFERDHTRRAYVRDRLSLPAENVSRWKKWMEAGSSRFLVQCGYDSRQSRGVLSRFASRLVDSASKSGTPVISYFCTLECTREAARSSGQTRQQHAMIAMVYAVIRQLIEMSPFSFDQQFDAIAGHISCLDGTLQRLPDALKALSALISLAPPILYLIIDGVDNFDNSSTCDALNNFISTLRHHLDIATGPIIKVMFTTNLMSRTLKRAAKQGEYVLMGGNVKEVDIHL